MFQTYTELTSAQTTAKNLARLREVMARKKLDAWLVPHADEHQNEYPPACAWRLSWLTGFTGSAGYCVVTCEHAVVFVDGRYTLQVMDQIDEAHFQSDSLTDNPPSKWLKNWIAGDDTLKSRSTPVRIGYDPRLQTIAAHARFSKALEKSNVVWVALENLIDEIWEDRPSPPLEPVNIHDLEFAGKPAMDKLSLLKEQLAKDGTDICMISDPASIAWALNIRGDDTPHTPLALGYMLLLQDGRPLLFMDKRKMGKETEAYLTQLCDLHAPSQLEDHLAHLAKDKTVQFDPAIDAIALKELAQANDASIVEKSDPISLPRAIKNETELEGSRRAHLRDGVAMCKFLFWLDQQVPGSCDEIKAAKALESIREQNALAFQSKLKDISFDTISGAGGNGAIVHYRVTENTNAVLENNSLYLVDSGAQYEDGTTDITRTIAIGAPPQLAREDFTLVLKGHIAIASARFPKGTRGVDLDPLARISLWQNGRDFAHGTGHGIGSYLAVHEGPQSISRRGMQELKEGMIVSNEPGFYREGKWGIRIENLVAVEKLRDSEDGNIATHGFETLSIAPIDLQLVVAPMLNDEELRWLNAYHGWVKRLISPHLEGDEVQWLEKATRPVSRELPAASA